MTNAEAIRRLKNITEGTIDHFDLEDAMDMLYAIKRILDHVEESEEEE